MTVESVQRKGDGAFSGYAEPERRPPLGSYAAFAAVFNAALGAGLVAARRTGHELPERIDGRDVLLTGIATHKLSRLVTKDKITSFVRAPFTQLEDKGGPAELKESARGDGPRRAVGELLSCPYCVGLWVSAGFNLGLVVAPRTTRFAASVLAGLTISDFLQIAYAAAEDRGLGAS